MCESKALSLWLEDDRQTRRAGAVLCRQLWPLIAAEPVVVFVRGNLGAGKSTFVRGFLTAAGITGVMPSPTYSLVEPYEVDGVRLFHMDAYRLSDAAELDYLGLDEMHQAGSVTLIEWPDHLRDALPAPLVTVDLSMQEGPDGPADAPPESANLTTMGRGLVLAIGSGAQARQRTILDANEWSEFRQVLT